MQGYIALHRKTIKSTVFQDDGLFKLWCYCLMKATHTEREILHGGILVSLKPGQFVTGRKVLTDELNSSEQKVRSRLALLNKMGNISVKSTNKYSIITVVKWGDYQTNTKGITNKQPTNNQQITTNNNVNNNNNVKNTSNQRLQKENDMQNLIPDVIKLFEEVDPKNKTYYGNKTQRGACQFLLDEYGFEEVKKRVEVLPQTNAMKFFPNITTPCQLRDKWVQLDSQIKRHQSENQNSKVAF